MKLQVFLCASASLCWWSAAVRAQNLVESGDLQKTAAPVEIAPREIEELISAIPKRRRANSAEASRTQTKLQRHVEQFLAGGPWMPLHQTLGISGAEVYFDHPDEQFYALSLALPFLGEQTRSRTRELLSQELQSTPPYAEAGYDLRAGNPRESYDVPEPLRRSSRGEATSTFGVYAFWLWCHESGDAEAARAHWSAIRERIKSLLASDYVFDIGKRNYVRDEAEKLNGDIAGLLGFARLARQNDDAAAAEAAGQRLRALVQLRVNLERTNPQILEKTNASTKSLHNVRLARYGRVTSELAQILAKRTDGLAAARLSAFREARNGWFVILGDRWVGGENYTSPLHFTHALFSGAALIERLPGEELLRFVDVPACRADLFFIEKCGLALERRSD